MAGALERRKLEHNDRAWAVWHIGVLSRDDMMAPKRYPDLKTLRIRDAKPVAKQTNWQDQLAAVQAWVGGFNPK